MTHGDHNREGGSSDEEILVSVQGLMLDPSSNVPVVILREENGERALPIWIGPNEANAIAMRLEGVDAPRPMTHDLFATAISSLGASLERIVITDLQENTFFARLDLRCQGEPLSIDARPSDALALALRLDAPIYIAQRVIDQAAPAIDPEEGGEEEKEEQAREWLEKADSDDLGEYEM